MIKGIAKVTKSWKFDNVVFVTTTDGADKKRNYYERKTSKDGNGNHLYFYFDGSAISFRFELDGKTATNLINEGPYKEFKAQLEKDIKDILPKGIKVEKEKKEIKIPEVIDLTKPVKHEKFEEIKLCVENEVPVYLYGPAGSGKNHVLQQIAEELELEFYFTNSVQQEYKITGFIDAGGIFHETEFYKAFKNGGLFFLDEMDASIPEVLVLLNAAIANGYFEFPNGKIDAHKDFRVVAAGNTSGNGADEQYTGRLQLDQATLDRFAFIEFDYDRNIELAIAKGNVELVDFVRELRKQAKDKGIRATFSYRSISMVQKLEGKLAITKVLTIAVFKGMDKDTINTFNVGYDSNKYKQALKQIQM